MEEDEDSTSSSTKQHQPTSNLVAPDSLKRRENVVAAAVQADEQQINNERGVNIEDYIKDSKTLNVNMLASGAETDTVRNNEINFDSEKFSRHHENVRPQETIDNLNLSETHTFDKKLNAKRFSSESPSSSAAAAADFMFDDDAVLDTTAGSHKVGTSATTSATVEGFCGIKRIRLDSADKEKNVQLEMERMGASASNGIEEEEDLPSSEENSTNYFGAAGSASVAAGTEADPQRLKDTVEADRYWEKYLGSNNTVIARTFQGQFKNTVVCSACKFKSVSFEPFMYLPVPLPNALVRQLEVTIVSNSISENRVAKRFLIDFTQADNVETLKKRAAEKIMAFIDRTNGDNISEDQLLPRLQVSEVLNHHISRTVEDWCMLKHLKDDKEIYVIEVSSAKTEPEEEKVTPCDQDREISSSVASAAPMDICSSGLCDAALAPAPTPSLNEAAGGEVSSTTNASAVVEFQSCVICMEELPPDQVRQHNACKCVMCNPCIERTIEHKGQIRCPGCRENADPIIEFVRPDLIGKSKPKLRTLSLPVLMRAEDGGSTAAAAAVILCGHPSQVRVANQVKGRELHELLLPVKTRALIPSSISCDLVLVDAQGKSCGRCLFRADPCRGCIRIGDDDEDVLLQSNDTIAVSFSCRDAAAGASLASSIFAAERDDSLNGRRLPEVISLEDCLEAFSEVETLDDNNPWYCPNCSKNQSATKTLTIWRLPDYLIVYLKR
jgi:hypothetical protein